MTRSCANCSCWDHEHVSPMLMPPEQRACLLLPIAVAKRPNDFCHSFRPIEEGHDARRAKA